MGGRIFSLFHHSSYFFISIFFGPRLISSPFFGRAYFFPSLGGALLAKIFTIGIDTCISVIELICAFYDTISNIPMVLILQFLVQTVSGDPDSGWMKSSHGKIGVVGGSVVSENLNGSLCQKFSDMQPLVPVDKIK